LYKAILTILLLVFSSGVFAQTPLDAYYNKTHRQLAGSPSATARADSILFTAFVVMDSIISAIQDGYTDTTSGWVAPVGQIYTRFKASVSQALMGVNSTDLSSTKLAVKDNLDVVSAATNASTIGLSVSGGTANLYSAISGSGTYVPLTFRTNALERARFNTDGKFGIGLTPISMFHLSQAATYSAAGGFKITTTTTGATLTDGLSLYFDSSNNLIFNNHEAGYLSFQTSAAERMQIGASGGLIVGSPTGGNQGAGTINATAFYDDGVLLGTASDIGDTTEVDLFWAMDTTKANASDLVLTALSSRRSVQYWSFDATNSDTLLFSLPIPAFVDSLEYVVPVFIANASSGNYLLRFKWEFTANDAAFDNSLTMTNSTDLTISAPSASGDIRYARTNLVGTSTDPGVNRWMDGMLIRVGGDGSDTASGNCDLIGFMAGWSRSK
jgi:hypothetical protein